MRYGHTGKRTIMAAYHLETYHPTDFCRMFLLGHENESDYNYLLKLLGLNQNMDYDEESNNSYINIYVTKNYRRKIPRKLLSCIRLNTFEQFVKFFFNRVTHKYNMDEFLNTNYDFQL